MKEMCSKLLLVISNIIKTVSCMETQLALLDCGFKLNLEMKFVCWIWIRRDIQILVQLSTSSQAKKWGAYFSAVCGWNSVPISATEAHGHRVCNRLLVFYPPGTFVLPHTCTQHPRGHGRFQKDLFRSRLIGFLSKQIQSTCFWTNPAVDAHGWADDVCMCGAKQKVKDVVPPKKSNIPGAYSVLEQQPDLR